MAINEAQFRSLNTGNGLSAELWHDCPLDQIAWNSNVGYRLHMEFMQLPTGTYTATQAGSAGTFTVTDAAGGIAIADSGDSDAGDGINIQFGGGEMFLPAAGKDIWFEARLKIYGAHPDFFLGLAPTDTTIITAVPAISTTNHLGLLSLTGDSVLLEAGSKASTATTSTFNGGTALTTATYYKLGFRTNGVTNTLFYLNGVKQTNTLATAYIPVTEMRPSLVCQSNGTGQPAVYIDWLDVVQLR